MTKTHEKPQLIQERLFYFCFDIMFISVEENMNLMKTLDDAWNSQDWDTFSLRHADDVIVRWPGQPPYCGYRSTQKGRRIFFQSIP
jgi:hypothetical protein